MTRVLLLLLVLFLLGPIAGHVATPGDRPTPMATMPAKEASTWPSMAPLLVETPLPIRRVPLPKPTPSVMQPLTSTFQSTPSPLPQASPEEVLIGPREGMMVHIGFDVEGDPRILYELLKVLEEEHYRTTFFLQGEWVKHHPEAARRIAAAGHELGNHSWSHRDMRTLTEAELERELQDTEALVKALTGRSTKPFFRPPYGSRNAQVRQVAYRQGYTTVIWTFGGQDWVRGADEESVYRNIVDRAAPGVIFYLHTSYPFNPTAVRRAVRTLRERGYRLVSLGEMLATP